MSSYMYDLRHVILVISIGLSHSIPQSVSHLLAVPVVEVADPADVVLARVEDARHLGPRAVQRPAMLQGRSGDLGI